MKNSKKISKKFDEWEVLPSSLFDEHRLYQYSNTTMLQWLSRVIEEQDDIVFDIRNGNPSVVCSLIPDDYDEDFYIIKSIEKIARNTFSNLSRAGAGEDMDQIADALRKAADILAQPKTKKS